MKKILTLSLLIIGMMISIKSNAIDLNALKDSAIVTAKAMKDSTVAAVKEIDTSSTFKQMYGDFKNGITALASSLKVGAEHVYEVLVKQQIVKAVVWIILFVFGFILILNWLKMYKSEEKWYVPNYNGDYPTFLGVFRFFQLVAAVLMFVFGIFHVDIIMTGFINPEYGALQDVIEMVKSIK